MIAKTAPGFRAAHSTTICLCNKCPNVHILLLDEQGRAFAAMTFDSDWAPAYAGHLIDHYGPPQHGAEELEMLEGYEPP